MMRGHGDGRVNVGARRARAIILIGNGVLALAVSVCLLAALGAGLAGAPALGRRLVPGPAAQVPATVPRGAPVDRRPAGIPTRLHAPARPATDSLSGRPEARR